MSTIENGRTPFQVGHTPFQMGHTTFQTGRTLQDDELHSTSISQFLEDLVVTQPLSPVDRFKQVSAAEHVLALTIIGLACFLGNGLVIHIYRQKQGYAGGKMYIIILAIIDIFACCTLLPAFPLMTMEAMQPYFSLIFPTLGLVSIAYAWILLTLTLERVLAIFKPFTIVENRRKLHRVNVMLWSFHFMLQLVSYIFRHFEILPNKLLAYINFVFILGIVLTISVSYLVMISKIMSHSQSMVKYRASDVTETSQRNNKAVEIQESASTTNRY